MGWILSQRIYILKYNHADGSLHPVGNGFDPVEAMYKYLSVVEMQAIEREADASGFTYAQMMEHAGNNLADTILDDFGYLIDDGVLGLVGSGNNGGDTLVALARLAEDGWRTAAALLRPRPPGDPLIERLHLAGGQIIFPTGLPDPEALAAYLADYGLLLDGVLGTGFRLPLKPDLAALLDCVKTALREMEKPPVVVAVDCPSGIDCDSGQVAAETIPADLTVTMAAVKQGLLMFPAFNFVGEIRVVGIGLPRGGAGLNAWQAVSGFLVDEAWVRRVLPPRPANAHKGTFGTCIIAAGSLNYTGAVLLAGEAAYRSGAGLVTLAVPAPLHAALAGRLPECTWLLLTHKNGFISSPGAAVVGEALENAEALLFGPGFGLDADTGEFIDRLLSHQRLAQAPGFPVVVDADGLKLLGRLADWPQRLPGPAVLTPHPGEMSLLTGLSIAEIQKARLDIARGFSREWGHVVVLKGAFTIIAAPDGVTAVIPEATPALARAGTGDVLAGLIAGLRAQGVPAFEAAAAGAWIHARAGIAASNDLGNPASVIAGDVLAGCIRVLSELWNG